MADKVYVDNDEAVAAWFAGAAGIPIPDPLAMGVDGQLLAGRLKREAEAARRRLTTAASTAMTLQLPDGGTAEAELTADTFARVAEPLLQRLRTPIASRTGEVTALSDGPGGEETPSPRVAEIRRRCPDNTALSPRFAFPELSDDSHPSGSQLPRACGLRRGGRRGGVGTARMA